MQFELSHCGCHNFFCDDDTMPQAVHCLYEEAMTKAVQDKKKKLRELWWANFWRNPPFWMRVLLWFKRVLC